MTTREKGTGLGLAIVKKIMEDHRGDLVLEDREGGGASVRLVFSVTAPPISDSTTQEGDASLNAEAAAAHGT